MKGCVTLTLYIWKTGPLLDFTRVGKRVTRILWRRCNISFSYALLRDLKARSIVGRKYQHCATLLAEEYATARQEEINRKYKLAFRN